MPQILCDGLGTAVHDGGMCATARDLARFGQMLLDGGSVPDEGDGKRTVIGSRWLREAWAVDADARSVFVASPAEVSMPGGGIATSSGSARARTATYCCA